MKEILISQPKLQKHHSMEPNDRFQKQFTIFLVMISLVLLSLFVIAYFTTHEPLQSFNTQE